MTDNELHTLVYQQKMPMVFMEMYHYKAGNVYLEKIGDEVKVNQAERIFLTKLRNGSKKKGGKLIFKLKEV